MRHLPAAVLAGTAVTVAQYAGGRYGPTPDHPATAAWYAALRKPSFTPPGPVFALAWTALDALLGYSGYRLLVAPSTPARTVALSAWTLNVLGVAGFSWVFFGRKRLDQALEVSAGMAVSAAALTASAAAVDRRAAWADVPLLGWVLFATLLQEEVYRRN